MKIIVCAKQVPNTNEIRIDPATGTLLRDGVPSILNPDDGHALEEALRVKDRYPGTHITVISMGPPQAREMLMECMAKGADECILVSDRAVGGSDTWATSNVIAAAIRKLGPFDLIFAGRQAIDGDTAQVGPQIAEKIGIPQVTYVKEMEIVDGGKAVIVKRALEDGYQEIKVQLPCMLTAIKELNQPRYMSVKGIFKACQSDAPIRVWTAADIQVDPDTVGLKASPTNVYKSFTPKPKDPGIVVAGETPSEQVENLLSELKKKHIV